MLTRELKLAMGAPGQPWLEWPGQTWHSIWESPLLSAVGAQDLLFSLSPVLGPDSCLYRGLPLTMARDAQLLKVPLACLFWWVGPVSSLRCAGPQRAVRWVCWVPGDLGQGQRTPGLLVQGPAEANLGAHGCGREGKVLGLEFELQVAGGQGVVRLAGGLGGDLGLRT